MKTTLKIESGKEYNHIVQLHALRTNECEVEIFFEDGSNILYPAGSFKRGNIYDISCVKIIFNNKAAFVATIIDKNKLQLLLS